MNLYNSSPDQEQKAIRNQIQQSRKRRIEQRRRRTRMRRLRILSAAVVLLLVAVLVLSMVRRDSPLPSQEAEQAEADAPVPAPAEDPAEPVYTVSRTPDTVQLSQEFPSEYAVVIDLESGLVLAEKSAQTVISPASMTKILTLLVAVQNITDWDRTFTMTWDIANYCYLNDCSVVGYEVGEVIPVRELLYGCILPSGADASLALAEVAAGSQEAFVQLMNEKLEELGLSGTAHFTNCVGLYDENHHCTVQDMALILKAALEDELCREVLSAKIYTTAPTAEHTEGQDLSNWFLRRIEDKDTGAIEVRYAKTGYVAQSGSCAASCGEDENGRQFLCVTANAYSSWRAIYDHVDLYLRYCQPDSAAGNE